MDILSSDLSAEAAYRLLVGSVVPRPIAWVTTLSENGAVNAAPFSAFTFLSNQPPLIGISIGRKAGELKDTARNIARTREFVVNIASDPLIDLLHATAHEYGPEVGEPAALGIAVTASVCVAPPRIAEAAINLECRLETVIEFGDHRTGFHVGRVEVFGVRDDLLRDGKIDSVALRPIARLGGPLYATIGETVALRPLRVTPK